MIPALAFLKNKYVIAAIGGAAALLLIWAAIAWYGNTREEAGWQRRDTQAKLELAARQKALYDEQMRLDRLTYESEERYAKLKQETESANRSLASELAGARSDLVRLRKQQSDLAARDKHQGSTAASGIDDRYSVWLDVIEECIGEYSALAGETAKHLDSLARWRGYGRAVTTPK